jgi:hypothetical protein
VPYAEPATNDDRRQDSLRTYNQLAMGRGLIAIVRCAIKQVLTEISGIPHCQLTCFQSDVQYVVGIGIVHSQTPTLSTGRPTIGLTHQLLCCRTADGGFGLIPLRQHILLQASQQPHAQETQWVMLASRDCQQCCPEVHSETAIARTESQHRNFQTNHTAG